MDTIRISGIEKQIPLTNMNAEHVLHAIENLTTKTIPNR